MTADGGEKPMYFRRIAWPMCGRPVELSCSTCARNNKPCYCDGNGDECNCWAEDGPTCNCGRPLSICDDEAARA